jgi:hypothetical protein
MKRRVRYGVALLVVVFLAGCTGAGPAARGAGGRPRCAQPGPDDQRPLFYIFCLESP